MLKILVADDEAMEREALQKILTERIGHVADVRVASNGQMALEVATLWKADIILMDIEMPGMSGMDATRAVRAQLPGCQIIFLTAYSVFAYAQEAVKLGVTDYLLKPAEDDEVLAAVEKAAARLGETAGFCGKPEPKPESENARSIGDKNVRIMWQVDDYLQKNYMKDISLESMAQTLDFSSFYFSKLFKQHFGANFVEYLAEIRVGVAKEILKDPTKSAKDIGALVGYPNPNYFVKLFKKKTGMTPTEYRNQVE